MAGTGGQRASLWALLGGLALLPAARGQAPLLQLEGACGDDLNGLFFELKGRTRDGAPWYKARDKGFYIYYDEACAGNNEGVAGWILDTDEPSQSRLSDLDSDGECEYKAKVSSRELANVPSDAAWQMKCDGEGTWMQRQLEFKEMSSAGLPWTTTMTSTTTPSVPHLLQVNGACQFKNWLNGMVFEKQGNTAGGAPYYKSRTAEYYIYYDPDCSGATHGFPRWIIDNDRPSLYKTEDLDDDHDCYYQARVEVNAAQAVEPPRSMLWRMECGSGKEDHLLRFEELTTTLTTTKTTTTRTVTVTSRTQTTSTKTLPEGTTTHEPEAEPEPVVTAKPTAPTQQPAATAAPGVTAAPSTAAPSATAAPPATVAPGSTAKPGSTAEPGSTAKPGATEAPAATEAPKVTAAPTAKPAVTAAPTPEPTAAPPAKLQLKGACSENGAMEGLVFDYVGRTRAGSPYYKAEGGNQYLYHDPSCAGSRAARWILDDEAPRLDRVSDLDNDGGCEYLARKISDDASSPSAEGTWHMMCGGAFRRVAMTMLPPGAAAPSTTSAHAHAGHGEQPQEGGKVVASSSLRLEGACDYVAGANGRTFARAGSTKSGAPYYVAQGEGEKLYIYWDPDCDGAGNVTGARWILDDSAPSLSAASDLDGDGQCLYKARISSEGSASPPPSATWKVYCGAGWVSRSVTLLPEHVLLSSGTCEDAQRVSVVDIGACQAAAVALGLANAAPVVIRSAGRPHGCYWDANGKELLFSPDIGNVGNGAVGGYEPVCALAKGDSDGPSGVASGAARAAVAAAAVASAVAALAMA